MEVNVVKKEIGLGGENTAGAIVSTKSVWFPKRWTANG